MTVKQKQYDPHVIVLWVSDTTFAVKEFPFKEDAEEKYNEVVQTRVLKVVLAKVIKMHGEG